MTTPATPVIARLALMLAALALTGACAPDVAVLPTPLPDLSKLAPSVQTQLRDAHQALVALVDRRAAAIERGQAYGDVGRLLMAAQFPDAPEAYLLNARKLDATNARWPYYLAHFYRLRGEPQLAIAHYEAASDLAPSDVAAKVWLAEMHLLLGQPDAAVGRFSEALALQPSSLSARFGLGRAALAQQDYAGAVRHLEDVLARDRTAAAAHYPLSVAYGALGDSAAADRHLRQRANHEILPADPLVVELETLLDSPQSHETRGIRALEANDWESAAAWFRKGLAQAPDQASLHHRLGAALSLGGDRRAARAEFERAVQLSADQFLAHYSLGVMDQEEGRHGDAAARLRAALEARPSYVPARVRLAASLRRTGHAAEALAEYRRALDGDDALAEANVGYAMTLAQLGRFVEARDHLERARQAAPESVAFAHGLARLLATAPDARVRDGARAREMVESLVAQGRTLDLGETMAMALAELGEFERAVTVQRDLVTAATRAGLEPTVARMTANLRRYQRRQPCRVPWTEQEWP
jgi:tetratricopeptide (TPR) repeat protein